MGKRYLVTGGAGFIGANFVRRLLQADDVERVVNLDLLTYAGSLDKLRDLENPERHVFIQGDIRDGELVGRILRTNDIDVIVNFAAESHVDRSIMDPAVFVRTNVEGTYQLLEQARQYWLQDRRRDDTSCRFHQISTDEVYGSLHLDDPAFTEQSPYAPNSPYSASKAAADHLVRSYRVTYGLPVTISCCSNNYGPFQHAEKLIPTIVRSCLAHREIPVYGDGSNRREWLYVTDHCEAIQCILRDGRVGETYNVGSGNEMSNLEMVDRICTLLDTMQPRPGGASYRDLIGFVPDRLGHDWRYAIDDSKLVGELHWAPATRFDDGLQATVAALLRS